MTFLHDYLTLSPVVGPLNFSWRDSLGTPIVRGFLPFHQQTGAKFGRRAESYLMSNGSTLTGEREGPFPKGK